MSPRTFTVPLAALAISLNNGCTDNIVGAWELVEVDGEEFPLEDSATYDGYTYSYSVTGSLEVTDELDAELEVTYSYSYTTADGETESYSYAYSYEGTVTPGKARGEYEIALEDDGEELNLDCTLAGDVLSCDEADLGDLVFERDD